MRQAAAAMLALLLWGREAFGQERTLSWKALDVSARLESDASLRVIERHAMVFDGAWNGGERTFRIEPGQRITLLHLRRLGETGVEELKLGNLAGIDHYAWSGNSLRWRTRLPEDLPYRNKTLTFEIEYVLYGIIEKTADGYRIDHDFAFPDRPGPIDRFTLQFEADPAWQAEPVPPLVKSNLPPGESVVLHQQLAFTAPGEPAHIYRRPAPPPPPLPPPPPPTMSPMTRAGGVGLLLLIVAGLVLAFFRHERAMGRFEKWDELLPEGEAWLEKNIFSYAPEVIGAAWDETSAEPEVSALLARLIQEGKITAVPKQINKQVTVTQLQLMVPRVELEEHERALVDALFVSGDMTDHAKIRSHYRAQGLDPAARLRLPMMRKVDAVTARAFGPAKSVSNNIGVLLIVAVFVTLVIGIFTGGGLTRLAMLSGVCLVIGLVLARRYRWKLLGWEAALAVVLPSLALVAATMMITHPVAFNTAAVMTVAITWYVLRKARWHGTREYLEWRRNLVAGHDWFAFELSKTDPQLKDEWTPYLIAFGLSSAMDAWAKSFAGPKPAPAPDVVSGVTTTPQLPIARHEPRPAPAWTGGGGSFGGAGATGGWAAELTKYAAVIPPPAPSPSSTGSSSWSSSSSSSFSSSSGFSSSSSSSRSGGGGGGGW